MVWVDFQNVLHTWTLDESVGEYGAYLYTRSQPTLAKRFVISDFDVDPDWPAEIRAKLYKPLNVRFDDLLHMRWLEKKWAEEWDSLKCYFADEEMAAKALGMNLSAELGLYQSCMIRDDRLVK
jgi:hypothetical protein